MQKREFQVSQGGQVVESSLWVAGFDPYTPEMRLVETASPHRKYDTILVQNAWNAISKDDFLRELRPYPQSMRVRAYLRRIVARRNMRVSRRVICLTNAVATQIFDSTGVCAHVAPVTLPVHHWGNPSRQPASDMTYALVTGTVTWYKRPHIALRWVANNLPEIDVVRFAGKDDGSGCWQSVVQLANTLGIRVERVFVKHEEIYNMYAGATVTVMPSALESLGFGLSEALMYSNRVVASQIAAHVEVAGRVGATPEWLGGAISTPNLHCSKQLINKERALQEWQNAGRTLGLNMINDSA